MTPLLRVRPPGDKSISHRALLLAALANGKPGAASVLRGLLTGDDVKSTARCLRQLGVRISAIRDTEVTVRAPARLRKPVAALHCGNSGTTARLLLGVLAAQPFAARLTGDASLRRRPMRRVTEPLQTMGARFTDGTGDGLPLTIQGGPVQSLSYQSPVASAQVKSAILLAALAGRVQATITEPWNSRDHTERLLLHLGCDICAGPHVCFNGPPPGGRLPPFALDVPGDSSSAAFLVAAALLAKEPLMIENVCLNPTRMGFAVVLERMGARIERVNLHEAGGEPVGDLIVTGGAELCGVEVPAAEVPSLVDEVPVLAILASRARPGDDTVFREVGELRVKESNRLELIAANLRAVGVPALVQGQDLHIRGTERPPRGRVETARDHRLAMAFAVLGTVPGAAVRLSERASVAISYPQFFRDLKAIDARHRD